MRTATSLLLCLALFFSVKTWSQKGSPAPNLSPIFTSVSPVYIDGKVQRHPITPSGYAQELHFEHLLPGETYSIQITDLVGLGGCLPGISTPDAGNSWAAESNGKVVYFNPKSPKMRVRLDYCANQPLPKEHWMSLFLETKKTNKLPGFGADASAVLTVEGGYSAEDLIKDVIIGGDCFDVKNVTFSGSSSQIGKFFNGGTNVGFVEGAILCTGDINIAPGPNSSNGAGGQVSGSTPDADLSQLGGGGSPFDLCNIEFDFTPTETPLTFQYVFASEEYCEYVNSQFNDLFGFFISGPGLGGPFGGAKNIATLPASSTYVGINSVNHLVNTGFFKNNLPAGMNNCQPLPDAGQSANELEFDGLTVPLVATAAVIPCSTYHIKLKIADMGDGVLDSAVFLKSGSFDGGGNASVETAVDGDVSDEIAIEGCDVITITFTRLGTNLSSPVVVQYTTTGSTATPGVDYTPAIPASVTIPAGQSSITLTFTVLTDAIIEGTEIIKIKLLHPCSCENPFYEIKIEDYVPMQIQADTIDQCGSGVVEIEAFPTGGNEPYSFLWSTGQNTSNIGVFVNVTTNYKVTVTDDCGKTKVATFHVRVSPPPKATTGGTAFLCNGGSGTAIITIHFFNQGPWYLTYTHNGIYQDPIEDIQTTPYYLTVTEPGNYQLVDCTNADGCDGTAVGSVTVFAVDMDVAGIVTNIGCNGAATGSINTTVTGGSPQFNYKWTPNLPGNPPDPVNLAAGSYTITVTDSHNCTTAETFTVTEAPPMVLTTAQIVNTDCAHPNGGSAQITVAGGAAPFNYLWSNGQVGNPLSNVAMGNYGVTVTDANNCTKSHAVTIGGDFNPPVANATANGQITCQIQSVPLSGAGSATGPNITYLWTTTGGAFSGPTNQQDATANAPGNYTIIVTNTTNGCTNSFGLSVPGSSDIPDAQASAPEPLTCLVNEVNLYGTGTASGLGITYFWSGPGLTTGDPSLLNQTANLAGTYTLVVSNSTTGCSKTSQAVVMLDNQQPSAQAATPGGLNCTASQLDLTGNGSSIGNQFSYNWTTVGGNIFANGTTLNPTITEPGSYQILVTNTTTGCTNTASVQVNEDTALPTAVIAQPGILNCTTGQFDLNAAGSSSGSPFEISWTTTGGNFIAGTNGLNPTINQPGSYVMVVTNSSNNCTAMATIAVSQDIVNPVADAGLPATLNCNITQLTIGAANPSGNPAITYSWSGPGFVSGQASSNPIVNVSGSYYLQVTNTQNGCSATSQVIISENVIAPAALIEPGGQLTCQATSIQLNAGGSTASPTIVYSWTTANGGSISSGGTTTTPMANTAGDYTILVTDNSNGCTAEATTTVTQSANLPIAIAIPDGVITCGNLEVELDATGSTEGADIVYAWQTINGNIVLGANSLHPIVDAPGQYSLLVQNTANNCQTVFQLNVLEDIAKPTAEAGPGGTLSCGTPAVSLNGAGSSSGANFMYEWTTTGGSFSPTSDLTSLTPTATGQGSYQILVTNTVNGCTTTDELIINQAPDVPIATTALPAVLTCSVQNLTLSGAGSSSGAAYGYLWTASNGGTIQSGSTGLSPVITDPGTYQLAVTDNVKGCTALSSVTVLEDVEKPEITAGPPGNLSCIALSTTLTGEVLVGTGPYLYNWQTANGTLVSGQNTPTPTAGKVGTYTLIVTDQSNGCTEIATTTVNQNITPPVADIATPLTLSCTIQQVVLNGFGSSQGPFTYNWTDPNGQPMLNIPNPVKPQVGTPGIYTLVVTSNVNGCTATTDEEVFQDIDPPVVVIAAPAKITCAVPTFSLNANGTSTGATFSYEWTTTDGNIIGDPTELSPEVGKAGTYLLTVSNSANGCSAQKQITVSEDLNKPLAVAATPAKITCVNPTVILNGTGSGASATITYLWTTTNGTITAGPTTLSPTVSKGGAYKLVVTNSANGCSAQVTVTVIEDKTPPTVEAGPPFDLTCDNPTGTLTGTSSPQTSLVWTTQTGNIIGSTTGPTCTVDKQGIYRLTATNLSNGCTAFDETPVTANNGKPSDLAVELVPPSCTGKGEINITAVTGGTGPYLYSINGGQNWFSTPDFSNVAPGQYTLMIQDVNGCEYSEPLTVPAPIQPVITTVPEIQLDWGDEIKLDVVLSPANFPVSQIETIVWTPLEGLTFAGNTVNDLLHPTAKPLKNTQYTVTLITKAGCQTTTQVLLKVDKDPHVYIPNVISPWSKDGDNDELIIFANPKQIIEITAFEMFDRWGSKIWADYGFQPNEPAHGWSSTVREKQLNPGVYVYWAKIKFIDGNEILYKGDVTIVK